MNASRLSATGFRKDPDMFDVPALVIHGDDDRVVPVSVGGQAPAAVIKNATPKAHPGAQRGMAEMHKEQPGADLLEGLNA